MSSIKEAYGHSSYRWSSIAIWLLDRLVRFLHGPLGETYTWNPTCIYYRLSIPIRVYMRMGIDLGRAKTSCSIRC